MNAFAKNPDRDWRLLAETSHDPLSNLAVEEAISRASDGTPTVRVWRNFDCVVLGRFQLLDAEVDQHTCERLNVPVYRRFTGGGAVYHDLGNINISLVIPRNHALVQREPKAARAPGEYALLLQPLANAISSLGVNAVSTDRAVLVRGRKVSGVAAWFGINTILVHATLLVDADLDRLERVLDGPGAPGNQRWERTRSNRVDVTSLAQEGFVYESVDNSLPPLIAALVTQFGIGFQPGALTTMEGALAAELLARKYSNPHWHADGSTREEPSPTAARFA